MGPLPDQPDSNSADYIGFDNPFCVLGLSASADGVQIRQASQRARSMLTLSRDRSQDDLADDLSRIERASAAMNDPVVRFVMSLHWIELEAPELVRWQTNPVTQALATDPKQLAGDFYSTIATSSRVDVRAHNDGVLACADGVRLVDTERFERAADSWQKGFERWSLCMQSADFRQRMLVRSAGLKDARLTAQVANDFIDRIPLRLLESLAKQAGVHLFRGCVDHARALVDVIKQAPFDKATIDSALATVYGPVTVHVETELQQMDERRATFERRPQDQRSDKLARDEIRSLLDEFKREIAPLVQCMLDLGDLPGLAEEHARDKSAEFLRRVAITAFNRDENVDLSLEATALAKDYANTDAIVHQLEQDLSQLQDTKSIGDELNSIIEEKEDSPEQVIRRLRQLRDTVVSDDARQQIDQYINEVGDGYAQQLMAEAMILTKAKGNPEEIERKFEAARKYASNPEAIYSLEREIRARGRSEEGGGCCLLIILAAIIAVVLYFVL